MRTSRVRLRLSGIELIRKFTSGQTTLADETVLVKPRQDVLCQKNLSFSYTQEFETFKRINKGNMYSSINKKHRKYYIYQLQQEKNRKMVAAYAL